MVDTSQQHHLKLEDNASGLADQEETWWFAILDQLFTLSERMEVCPMSLHVVCELGQGIRLHLLEHPLGGVPGVQVDWPVAAVHSVPVQW